jgi:signal transduction histidine kinase
MPLRRRHENELGRRRGLAAPTGRRRARPSPGPVDATESLIDRLERAEAAYRELLSVVSHDLRNPLSVVLVGARLLERRIAAGTPERRSVESIARGADEINRLVQDLVDARRIEEGRFEVERAPVALGAVVDRVLGALAASAAQRKVELRRTGELGEATASLDDEAIVRALAALVADALRSSPAGAEVALRAELDETSVSFVVEDHGPGLDAEGLEAALTRPLGARARARQGGSVSVFVARGIAEAHGGTASVHATPGGGCTVRVTLPRG